MKRIPILTGALVLLLVLAGSVVLVSAAPASRQASDPLAGTQWSLVAYADASGRQTQLIPNTAITAEFKDGKVGGSDGCNIYSAPYEIVGGSLKIGQAVSTMRACQQAIMKQAATYLANLQAAATYKIEDDKLLILNAKGATVLTYEAVAPGSLTGVAWQMTFFNNGRGGFESALADVVVTAEFDEQGTVAGNAGCNNYSAPYTIDGDKIDIGPALTTRMMCPQPVMDQEAAYLKALDQAATFEISGGELSMRDSGGASMVAYVEAALPEPPPAAPAAAAPKQAVAADPSAPQVYVGLLPAADASVRAFALVLNPDGTVQFRTDLGKETPISEGGTWKDEGATLTMTLTEKDGKKLAKPVAMKFAKEGTYLTLVDYDKAVWGSQGLKLNLAADVARKVRSAMMTIDLAAGFPLDPTFVSVNGGGEVDAKLLGGSCSGYIHRQPVVTVKWSGKADMVRAFFYSDADPTLVVLTPKGELLCNDNAGTQLLDPFVEIQNPVEGEYRIWVGSAAKNQLIPGVLVLTSKTNMDLGTFNLGGLVKRPSIPQQSVQATEPAAAAAPAQALAAKAAPAAVALGPGAKVTVEVTADGIVPLFKIPAAVEKGCGGLVTGAPSYVFKWTGKTEGLNVAFEGDGDSTLMVVGQNSKLVLCNDDAAAGNTNPAILIPTPADDTYLVYVGRINPEKPVKGTLTVTESGKE